MIVPNVARTEFAAPRGLTTESVRGKIMDDIGLRAPDGKAPAGPHSCDWLHASKG